MDEQENIWSATFVGWKPEQERLRETLCTIANGYCGIRGAWEGHRQNGCSYPGTYIAGLYNRVTHQTELGELVHETLVNLPNPLTLRCRVEGGDWWTLEGTALSAYRQTIHFDTGVMTRSMILEDPQGRRFQLVTRRLASLAARHLVGVHWTLKPLDFSGVLEVQAGFDCDIENKGVAKVSEFPVRHFRVEALQPDPEPMLCLTAVTSDSGVRVALAQTLAVEPAHAALTWHRPAADEQPVATTLKLWCEAGQPLVLEKILALQSSADTAVYRPEERAREWATARPGFAALEAANRRHWACLWKNCDIRLDCPDYVHVARMVHFNLFHVLQTLPVLEPEDVGIPARGLHGEGYLGQVFWDETFLFPYLVTHFPQVARALIMYRFNRLPRARLAASNKGYGGALFPWRSASDGREVTPSQDRNPLNGQWLHDPSCLQRHINGSIAYIVYQYGEITGDRPFMAAYGLEMMIEIARFWASAAVYSPQRQRYEIRGVMGPDEYHSAYPGASHAGIDNNAYTNLMAAWCLQRTASLVREYGATRWNDAILRLDASEAEARQWERIGTGMFVPFMGPGLIEQFEGFGALQELDWGRYRQQYGDVRRIDYILQAEGDDVNRYQVIKQADVLMIFYLFSPMQLSDLFASLGYRFTMHDLQANLDYYRARTSGGSTLGRMVHSWILARSDDDDAWTHCLNTLAVDLEALSASSTSEGIHMGALAGSIDLLQRGFTGLDFLQDKLWLRPVLPEPLRCLEFQFCYRATWIGIKVEHECVTLKLEQAPPYPLTLVLDGREHELSGVGETRLSYGRSSARAINGRGGVPSDEGARGRVQCRD